MYVVTRSEVIYGELVDTFLGVNADKVVHFWNYDTAYFFDNVNIAAWTCWKLNEEAKEKNERALYSVSAVVEDEE